MDFLTNINLNKNELQNARIQNLSIPPSNPKAGLIYFDTNDNLLKQYDGTAWVPVGKDTYIGSAAFTDDTSNNSSSPVKLTLTRQDKDGTSQGTVTGNIPKVSSSSAGVAPKGAAVSTQSQTTKFLREDGTWSAPSYTPDNYSSYVKKDGTTAMTGALNMDSHKVTNVTDPTNAQDAATKNYVDTAITNLPEPMIFKGSLGTGGTITALPTASSANEGFTYKVITAGTYASQEAKVGDTFISDGSQWVLIPSGDEPSGTVTSVTIQATSPISIDSSSAITTSGTRTISHADSGVTAGTYPKVTVNATGHVTGGSPLAALDIPDLSATYKTVQTAKTDPAASGNALAFIDTISQDTDGVITATKKNVQADSTPTANSSNLVTSGGVYAAIQDVTGGSVHKKTVTSPALTASGGAWTWTISGSDAMGTSDITLSVYEVSSGAQVIPDITINQSTGAITIIINDTESAGSLSAGTYKAVIVG